MSDENTYAALAADMVKVKRALGNVVKNKKANAGSHSYAYSDLAAVTAAIDSAVDEAQAALWFSQDVTTTEASVTVISCVIHANGARHESRPLTLPVLKRDPQGFGSAISYARRYGALAFFGIAAEDDDGKSAGEGDTHSGRQNGHQGAQDDSPPSTVSEGRKKAIAADLAACESRQQLTSLWNSLDSEEQNLFRQRFNEKRPTLPAPAKQ